MDLFEYYRLAGIDQQSNTPESCQGGVMNAHTLQVHTFVIRSRIGEWAVIHFIVPSPTK